MATYATNMSDFWLEGATTVTAIGTGGAGLGNPETDFFIQSAGCISKGAWTNAIKGFIIDALGTTFTVPTDGAVIGFIKYDAAGSLAAKSAGGLQMIVGSGDGDYNRYYIGGNNTLAFDSWVPYTVDPNTATADGTAAGTPDGSERWVGVVANLPTTSGPTKGNPIAMDAIRYGRCDIEYTSTGCTFSGAEAWANDSTRRWGLIALRNGSYLIQGFHSFGTSGASCTFSDSNKVLFILPSGNNNLTNDAVSTAFNRLEILNGSSTVTWDNISISALGTRARGVFVHTAGTFTATNCQFVDMDTFSLLSTATATGCTWRRCNAVTAPATDLRNSKILASTVALDTGALIYNSATDPNGKLDGMEFSKGAAAHHAIDFGTSVTADITLRGVEFTGFGSTDDSNDSTVRFLATSGDISLNLIGCTVGGVAASAANFSIDDAAGITVTPVFDPVDVKVTSVKSNGDVIGEAYVHLRAKDGTGPFHYNASVSVSRAGTTATVTQAAGHILKVGDKFVLRGITDKTADNAVHTVTAVSGNDYNYTTTDSGSTSYAGTITSTFVALDGLTNITTGVITTTRYYSANQPVIGWARKSTSSPFYKEGSINKDIDSNSGLDYTAVMVLDE